MPTAVQKFSGILDKVKALEEGGLLRHVESLFSFPPGAGGSHIVCII